MLKCCFNAKIVLENKLEQYEGEILLVFSKVCVHAFHVFSGNKGNEHPKRISQKTQTFNFLKMRVVAVDGQSF